MQHVLAIDQGTSGTKAIVVDESGRVVSIAEVAVRPEYLPGGGVEQDPEALFDSVVNAGRQALAQAGVPVAAVAVANQGETVLAWDRDTGRPLTPAVVWQDRRAESICASLTASADTVAQRTGLVLDPYFSAPKMAWIRANMTAAGVVTTTDTWLVHRLCGAFVTDASTASRSLLIALDSVAWDDELLGLFGLTGEALPEIVGSDQIVGSTDVFGPTIPVAGLIVDQQAALLAESCLKPGDAKCTFGTGAFLLAQLGGNPARSTSGLTTSVAWRLREDTSYCVDGQVYTAASAVRWAVDLGLVPAADQIDAVAADSSDGVLCVPALAGLAAPWWDSAAAASFTGMTLSQRPRTVGPRTAGGHRRTGRRAGRPRRHGSGSAVDPAAGGRRAHPLRRTHAGTGRPGPHPRRRLPVAARHGPRRRRVRAVGPRAGHRRGRSGRNVDARTHLRTRVACRPCRRVSGAMDARGGIGSGREGDNDPMSGTSDVCDVIVVGGGIVGCAIARALAGTNLSVTLLEARDDVGDGTSKANTALLHTGYDASPGTLESRLVARGYELLGDYAEQTGIPVERTGALLVAWTDEERDALPGLKDKAERNFYHQCEIVTADEVYRRVPDLGPGALAGLTVPGEAIICTWTTNLALATDAVARGARLLCGARVTGAVTGDGHTTLQTTRGDVQGRWVINAAGLGADYLDAEFGHHRFTVTPRRGELLVFDKLTRPMVPCIVLAVPSSRGKGVLVSPTIYGNVMVGPTSENLEDRTATGTSEEGFEFLLSKGRALMPSLFDEEITATYAGLRAAIDRDDYLIDVDAQARYLLVGGIRSTGLTSGMAIAEYLMGLLDDAGLDVTERPDLPAPPRMPNLGEVGVRPYQDAERIAADPEYGRIVCFCERVTAGEIRDAFQSPVPPADLDGLRRRTRVMNGRCQGFYCGAHTRALLDARGGAR